MITGLKPLARGNNAAIWRSKTDETEIVKVSISSSDHQVANKKVLQKERAELTNCFLKRPSPEKLARKRCNGNDLINSVNYINMHFIFFYQH